MMLNIIQERFYRLLLSSLGVKIKKQKLTYLTFKKLFLLEKTIKAASSVPGDFIEAGVALGGTSILIASEMPSNRKFSGYDVFGMIPEPKSNKDDTRSKERYNIIKSGQSSGIKGDIYYGYIQDLYGKVKDTFRKYNLDPESSKISLVKGLFEETLKFREFDRIAFAHIDCDWYDPVRLCLNVISPVLSVGGYIVLDDYCDYGGCKNAVDEFLNKSSNFKMVRSHPNCILVKKS
jgi:O-methyltransferase